jgi:RNA polymerase sigma-70 factor (ECF subfamily)
MALTEIDRSLLDGCLTGDHTAWKDFVDRYVGLFVHVAQHTAQARSVKLSPVDIEDVCAEILLTLIKDDSAVLRRFRGTCSLATYLAVVARRIAVREISRRRMAEALGHVAAKTRLPSEESKRGSSSEHKRVEDREIVQRILVGLPDDEAEIVRLFHLEGRSYREISNRLGIPENAIGPTLSRARKKMRQGNGNA